MDIEAVHLREMIFLQTLATYLDKPGVFKKIIEHKGTVKRSRLVFRQFMY